MWELSIINGSPIDQIATVTKTSKKSFRNFCYKFR